MVGQVFLDITTKVFQQTGWQGILCGIKQEHSLGEQILKQSDAHLQNFTRPENIGGIGGVVKSKSTDNYQCHWRSLSFVGRWYVASLNSRWRSFHPLCTLSGFTWGDQSFENCLSQNALLWLQLGVYFPYHRRRTNTLHC